MPVLEVPRIPRDDLNDHAALEAFVDTVKSVTPEVAGSAAEPETISRSWLAPFDQRVWVECGASSNAPINLA